MQTLPGSEAEQQGDHHSVAEASGFSPHAGLDIRPHQRAKLERLCRYISCPPIAVERLALTASGQVRYTRIADPARRAAMAMHPINTFLGNGAEPRRVKIE